MPRWCNIRTISLQPMSNTSKIQFEIYEDKIIDFYFSLLHWKTTEKADIKVLKTIVNAIIQHQGI